MSTRFTSRLASASLLSTTTLSLTALFLTVAGPGCNNNEPAPATSAAAAAPAPSAPGPNSPTPTPAAATSNLPPSGTPESLGKLAAALGAGEAEIGARATALLDGLRTRVKRLAADRPIGREPLAPAAAAEKLIQDPKATLELTGIECGALAKALFDAANVPSKAVLVFERQAGRTNLRRRDLGLELTIGSESGVALPCREAPEGGKALSGATGAAVNKELESALFLGLQALYFAEQRRLDDAMARAKDAEKAADAATGGQAATKDHAFAFLRGQLRLIQGDTDGGLEDMEQAVAASEDADGQYQLAVAYLQSEEQFSGFKALKRASTLDPKHARALAALGNLALERRRSADSTEHPALDSELTAIATTLEAIGPNAPGLVELKAQRLRVLGKPDEAEKLVQEALASGNGASSLHMMMADIATAKGDSATAELHLEKAAAADEFDAEPLVRLAQLQADRGDVEKTIQTFATAIKRAPHDSDLLSSYASILLQAGRVEEAKGVGQDLKTRFPRVPDGYALLAQLEFQGGNMPAANTLLEQAITQNEKADTLYVMLYMGYVLDGAPDKAKGVLDRLLKHDPDGRMKIAESLLQTGQFEGAAGLLEAEFAARPEKVEAAITLGQIYRVAGKAEEVTRLRTALEAKGDPELVKTFDAALVAIDAQAAGAAAPGEGEEAPEQPAAPEAPPVPAAPVAPPAAETP